MTLLSQAECEQRMYRGGINRAEAMMTKAEDKGRAITNPYAKEIMQEYILPLAQAIRIELDTKRPGQRKAHATLLRGLDEDTVAYLTVRSAVNHILQAGSASHRQLAYEIGKTIHNELVLSQIEDSLPELYHTLSRDLGRRLSKDERHRMTVFKMQAARAGIVIQEWPVGARDQVGMYMLGLLQVLEMVDIEASLHTKGAGNQKGKQPPRTVTLTQHLMERIDQIKAHVAITMPVYGPCVEPPMDWVTPSDGGFHSRELRRTHPTLVRHRLARTPLYRDAQMPVVLKAVNTLQRTAWQVNTRMLDIVLEVAKHFNAGEITSLADMPKPEQPAWLAAGMDKEAMNDEQKLEFKKWKRKVATWFTERKLLAVKYARFYSATRGADMFRDYPAIYFVYFADSRGRLYPMTYGINPQGSDLQRSLIRFSKGKPVNTPDAIKWFHVQGANKWGFDKATLKERQAWVVERQELLLSFADDPINNRGWTEAGDPLQFLAWCLEYRDWVNDSTGTFRSHLPISMDGSCNGLQNLSALLRDEIGGQATNLTSSAVMQDIYRKVADAGMIRLASLSYEDETKTALLAKWIAHGVTRSVVKRSVMTTPYGVTKRSAIEYVVEDYLKKEANPFEPAEYLKAATVLMDAVWPAIGDVVVKGRECMAWLQKSARVIVRGFKRDEEPLISWMSPSGFPASQAYFELQEHRINSNLAGPIKLKVVSETDDASVSKHASGLAPNFVHSMDAAHLHLTTAAAAGRLIDALAMIHDDYGTWAADSEELFQIIREQFVLMYERCDPVEDFKKKYPCIPMPPTKGSLDIREVLQSTYFFS
jgi:DNA-directed RNA polymerase